MALTGPGSPLSIGHAGGRSSKLRSRQPARREPGRHLLFNRAGEDSNRFREVIRVGRNNSSTTCQEYVELTCLVQVGNGIELEAVGLQFEPYQWRPCGVTWDSSRTAVVIKLLRTSALNRD